MREKLATEVARHVFLQFLMNLSLVTSQATLGLEVRLTNVTNVVSDLSVSLQVGFHPPLVAQNFETDRTGGIFIRVIRRSPLLICILLSNCYLLCIIFRIRFL